VIGFPYIAGGPWAATDGAINADAINSAADTSRDVFVIVAGLYARPVMQNAEFKMQTFES